MKARNENLLGRLQNLPPAIAAAIFLLHLAAIGIADFHLPFGLRFTLPYLVGVTFIAWCAGPRLAFAGAVLTCAVSMAVEFMTPQPSLSIPIQVWNESSRTLIFIATGYLIGRAANFARRLGDLVEERTADLRAEADQHKATATTLAETVERFEQVVNNITEVFWLSELPDYRVIYASPGYEKVWGRMSAEVCGDRATWLATLHPDDRERISRRFSPEQSEGGYEVEYRILRPDGAVRWIRDRAFPVRNQQGEVHRIAGLAEDITERRRTRVLLERQAAILESMAEAAMMTDDQGTIVLTNPAFDRQLGYEPGELMGKPLATIAGIPPEEQQRVFHAAVEQVRTVGPIHEEYLARRKDGSLLDVEARSSGATVEGRFGLVIVGQDITQRKRAEQALRESEATLRALLDAISDPAFLMDKDGKVLVHNPALAVAVGARGIDLRGKCIFGLLPPDLAKTRKAVFDHVVQSRLPEQFEDVHDGRTFISFVNAVLDAAGNVTRVAVFALEITESKKAETALREAHDHLEERVRERTAQLEAANKALIESEAQLRLALDASNAAIWSWNSESNDTTWDDSFHQHYGFGPEIPKSFDTWINQVHPADRPKLLERIQAMLAPGGDNTWNEEFRALHPCKGERWMGGLGHLERDETGRAVRITGINLDITERKRAEEELRASEERLQLFLRNTAVIGWIKDEAGRYSFVSQNYVRRFQTPREAWIGKTDFDLWPQPIAEQFRRNDLAVLQAAEPIEVLEHASNPDGSLSWWMVSKFHFQDHAGKKYVGGMGVDISDRKHVEEALRSQLAYIETIYQNAPVGLCVLDLDLRYVRINERLAAMNGFPVERHLGRSMREMVPYLAEGIEAIGRQVIATAQPVLNLEVNGTTEAQPGVIRTWVSSWVPIKQPDGRVTGLSLLVEEITARKQAEEALRVQFEYIETIYRTAPVGLCALDSNFRYLRINELLAEMNGRSVSEHIGRTVREIVPHLAAGSEAVCRQVLTTGQPVLGLELEGTPDAERGVRRSWVTHWVPLKQADGRATGVSVLVEEVTQRKQMLRALQESEEKYRRLFESMTDAFVRTDMTGRLVEFNPAYQALLGYTAEELRHLTYMDLTPEKWRGMEARMVEEQLLPQGYSEVYEKEYRRKDGTVIPVELRTFLLRDAHGQRAGMWAIVRDITRRKRTEESLREAHDTLEARVTERTAELVAANAALAESEERYRSLVTNLNVGVYRNTPGPDGRFLHANPALARMHGFDSVEEFMSVRVSDTYQDPADRTLFLAELLRRGSVADYELRLMKKDGTPIYGSVNAITHRGPNGEVDWIDGMIEDITQRKQAEEALRTSEERYRTLAESSPDAIFILDRDIRVQYVNSTAAALWQRQPKDLIGLTQADLFPAETAQRQADVVSAVFETGNIVRRERPVAFPVGDQWIEVRLAPLYDAQGRVASVMGIARNITEHKRAEQQLAETLDLNQKMIAASAMGIAAYKASGECVFANEALARIVGGSPSDVLQGNFRRLTLWRECGMLQQADEALSQGQTRSLEILGTTRFGKSISLDCHVAPFVSKGQPHLLVMGMDISERKRAEEALRMQSLILQNMAEGTLLTAPDQTILFANSALEAMFGYEPGGLKGKPVNVLNAWSPEETVRFNQVVMQATEGGEVWHGQYQNRRKDGTVFTSESRVIRLAMGGQDHFISVQQDITERQRAQSLLQAQRDVGVSLSLTSDMAVALRRFLEIAVQIGGLDCGGVYLLNRVTQELDLTAHHGLSDSFVQAVTHYAADSPAMKLVLQGRSVFNTYQDLPVHLSATELREGLRTIAVIPLSHNRRIIGALNMASHTVEEIPVQARMVIEAISAQAAGAIARISAEAERYRLERQLLEISDREHARIGQDIHDGLCQQLVSLALDANSLRGELAGARRPEAKKARRIADYLDLAITEARQLSRGLFPVRLEREGLPPALEELAVATHDRFKIRCRFASEGPVAVESSVTATHLYRIAQEAVSNAVKHSRASSVAIRLCARAGVLELSVTDNGEGLSPARRKEATGMGLHIMDYRARTIGGMLQISPGRQRGTKVSCCVPVPASGESSV